MNQTFVMIKPEAIDHMLIGEVIRYFEEAGFIIAQIEIVFTDKNLMEAHYIEHREKKFFDSLISRYINQKVIALELCLADPTADAISLGRKVIGNTYPEQAEEGTIRGDFKSIDALDDSVHLMNLVHASDSIGAARRELSLWFPQENTEAVNLELLASTKNLTPLVPE
jgi:nucleoside-diphosphate kinase